VDRIVDVFPPHHQHQIRVQLSSVLEAVFSQQLVTRAREDGRVPAVEVLIATPAIRNLIREGKTQQIYNAIQTGGAQGMQTMEQSLFELVKKRLITPEEAMDCTMHPEDLKRMLDQRKG
jgi:twitching motility protein PilT